MSIFGLAQQLAESDDESFEPGSGSVGETSVNVVNEAPPAPVENNSQYGFDDGDIQEDIDYISAVLDTYAKLTALAPAERSEVAGFLQCTDKDSVLVAHLLRFELPESETYLLSLQGRHPVDIVTTLNGLEESELADYAKALGVATNVRAVFDALENYSGSVPKSVAQLIPA